MDIKINRVWMLLLLFTSLESSARFKNLSLEMEPSVFQAHWWLNYEAQALKEKWLIKQITCHFNENNNECHNLAALLRMYAEVAPQKVVEYGLGIMPKLEYDEYHQLEVALFLFLYANDRRFMHVLDKNDVEYYDETMDADPWLTADILNSLASENAVTVENAIKDMLKWPSNETMNDAFLEPMITLAENEKRPGLFIYANLYLLRMGYLGYFNEMAYEFDDIETITITSGVIDLSEYLDRYPISKVWQYHAKTLSANRMNNRDFASSELFNVFNELAYSDDAGVNRKIAFIKKLSVFRNSSSAMKYQIGNVLMYKHPKEGTKILKQVYKKGRPAMKSALVIQYPELFPVKNGFWQKMKNQSSEVEKRLVERNEAHTVDTLKQQETNRKAAAKRAERRQKNHKL